jgi:hypothetical protein
LETMTRMAAFHALLHTVDLPTPHCEPDVPLLGTESSLL